MLLNRSGHRLKPIHLISCLVLMAMLCVALIAFAASADESDPANEAMPLEKWYSETAKEIQNPLVITHYIALCDNEHQGIVPVSKKLGDGDNPDTNLYWGAMYGYRTWFDKSPKWSRVLAVDNPTEKISQVIIHTRTCEPKGLWKKNGVNKPFRVYLILIGYRGRYIDDAVGDYLGALFGKKDYPLPLPDGSILHGAGHGRIVSYSGHNYLMDLPDQGLSLLSGKLKSQQKAKATMILACASKQYFHTGIARPKTSILALTTNFMAPEAYTADAMYEALLAGNNSDDVVLSAAKAYAKYQRISVKSAAKLFWSGR
jgi:hypothetical protein